MTSSFKKQTTHRVLGKRAKTALALLSLSAGSALALSSLAGSPASADMMSNASSMIANWPMDTQKAAKTVIAKYGAPNEATPSMLVWYNKGNWKRIVASRTPVMHHFPGVHPDSMEQFLSYRVPLDKYDDLARFDGSVGVNRTKGELSARCDAETHNLLALNLAHDIITGKRSVASARAFYTNAVKMEKTRKVLHPYMLRLMFRPHGSMAVDHDVKTIK